MSLLRKKLLNRRSTLLFGVLALTIFNLLAPVAGLSTVTAQVDAGSLLAMHNQEREELGIGQLSINVALNASATAKAQAMLAADCWSHYCPEGTTPWEYFESEGYAYIFAGENLAEGFYENSSVMTAWMNSETHKANILNPNFTEIGFGFARGNFQGNSNNTVVVVHFGKPLQQDGQEFVSDQLSTIPQPTINYPADQSHIDQPLIEVSGSAPEAARVALVLDGNQTFFADANMGIFTYQLDELEDKTYTLLAQSIQGIEASEFSDLTTFTIDTQPDPAETSDMVIFLHDQGATLQLFMPQLSAARISYDSTSVDMTRSGDGSWGADLADEIPAQFELETVDQAGNTTSATIDTIQIEAADLSPNILPPLSVQDIVNIIAIMFILLVVITDATSNGGDHHQKKVHHHWHVGILLILLLVIVINNTAGHILTGLNL